MAQKSWSGRLGKLTLVLGVASIAVALIGPTLARYDIVSKIGGFSALLFGGLLAVITIVVGIIAMIVAWRGGGSGARAALVGLVPALLVAGFLGYGASTASQYPALHDASTDLENPPEFSKLELREDNLAGVGTVENWRQMHAEAYPDLQTVTIDKPVSAVITDAERLATERGWDIAYVDPEGCSLEATASVAWIKFYDDVVLRVRPAPQGNDSLVDMRSVSRVGVGDLGENANRVRAFLSDLKEM